MNHAHETHGEAEDIEVKGVTDGGIDIIDGDLVCGFEWVEVRMKSCAKPYGEDQREDEFSEDDGERDREDRWEQRGPLCVSL